MPEPTTETQQIAILAGGRVRNLCYQVSDAIGKLRDAQGQAAAEAGKIARCNRLAWEFLEGKKNADGGVTLTAKEYAQLQAIFDGE